MKIEKNKLVKVFWKSPRFSNKLKINGIKGIILDSIEVVECERGISNFPHHISVEDKTDRSDGCIRAQLKNIKVKLHCHFMKTGFTF